jgi:hypothetical protein
MKSNGARSSYNRYGKNSYSNMNRVSYNRSVYNRYNYTSEAFDYAGMAAPPVRKRKVKKKKRVIYSKVKEVAPLSLLKTYGTIAVIFCFVLALLCLYASNSSLRMNLVSLQDRLVATQEDNEYIRVSIDENLDLDKIQTEAMKLGFQMPAEYQIMEINVPKDSYTVQYDSSEDDTEEGFWSFFKNLFKG